MVKKFTIPFASQGDANDIPDALQVDGKVSFTQGFGYDYERPYDDPQSKDIAREDMNGLFNAITSAVGELQTLGASEWSNAVSYPKGAIVYFEKDLYISQVDDNQNTPPQNWVSITSIANDSLKKTANLSDLINKDTARNNLGLGSSATLNKTDVLGTSTNLVATQKLVNDTKINLENSKQDKLTFVGDGKVMREGAYGLGGRVAEADGGSGGDGFFSPQKTGFYNGGSMDDIGWGTYIALDRGGIHRIATNQFGELYTAKVTGAVEKVVQFYSNDNTTVDSSGFLRASGSKETLTKDLVTQSAGSSTTNVMSQKAVTDLVKINTASKNQNGWWKCGDTGLIYQWGADVKLSGVAEVNFPISFSSACFSVIVTINGPATNADTAVSYGYKKESFNTFIVSPSGIDEGSISYIAVGY